MDDSSPLRIHGIPEKHFLPLADKVVPAYRSFSVIHSKDVISARYSPVECSADLFEGNMDLDYHTVQDHDSVLMEPQDLVNSIFYSPVQVSCDGLHDVSVDSMGVPDEAYEGPSQFVEYTQQMIDYEHSDFVLQRSSLYHDSFSSPSRSCATAEAHA